MLLEKSKQIRSSILSWNWPPVIKKLLSQWLSLSFLKYLLIGFSSFFIQIALLFVFTQIFKMEKVPGNIVSTLLSMIFNFLMSNYWTFKSDDKAKASHGSKLIKYLILAVFNYCFDTLLAFPLLAVTWHVNQYISKVIITAMIVMWNFFIYKFWVFKKTDQ